MLMITSSSWTMIVMFMTTEPTMVLTKIPKGTVMGNPAVTEDNCSINEAAKRSDLMEDDEYAGVPGQQIRQRRCQDPLMLKINSGSRLVQYEKIWLTGKCPGNKQSLLLAAR
jgi:hypothetical protein